MLPQAYRMNSKDFKKVFGSGKRISTSVFSLLFDDNPHPTPSFSVVVGKKIMSRAVDRNRARRRVYSILFSFLSRCKPVYGIVLVRKDISDFDEQTLYEHIAFLLEKADIIEITPSS